MQVNSKTHSSTPIRSHTVDQAPENERINEDLLQQHPHNIKSAVDIAAYATKESCPAASIVIDCIGFMASDNAFEAFLKILSIIDTANNL